MFNIFFNIYFLVTSVLIIFYPQFITGWAGLALMGFACSNILEKREKIFLNTLILILSILIIIFPFWAIFVLGFILIIYSIAFFRKDNIPYFFFALVLILIGIITITYPSFKSYFFGILIISYSIFKISKNNSLFDFYIVFIFILGFLTIIFPHSIGFFMGILIIWYVTFKRIKKSFRKVLVPILIIMVAFYMFGTYFAYGTSENINLPNGPQITKNDRILIIAPHPDDESISSAGLISRAVKNKIPVSVVLMTNGDEGDNFLLTLQSKLFNLNPMELGIKRHYETLNAMKFLGLNESSVHFLSYHDESLVDLFNHNWDYNFPYIGMNDNNKSLYSFAYQKNAPYCGENVYKNLNEIITQFKPTIIIFPDPSDTNPDHEYTNAFVEYTLTEMKYNCEKYTYLVHKGIYWPFPRDYSPDENLLPPFQMLDGDAKWMIYPITNSELIKKGYCMDFYQSQQTGLNSILESFVRNNELFAVYPTPVVRPDNNLKYISSLEGINSIYYTDIPIDLSRGKINDLNNRVSIGFEYNNSDATLIYKSSQKISPFAMYRFHIRLFLNGSVKRMDFDFKDGKLSSDFFTINRINIKKSTYVIVENNKIVIHMPSRPFKESYAMMIDIDTFKGGMVSKTGWRVWNIKN